MQILLNRVQESERAVGLDINKTKTEYMLIGDFGETIPSLHLAEGPIERAEDFRYLGSWISEPDHDLDVRKAHASNGSRQLNDLWKSDISRPLRLKVFRACVVSVPLYGAESWSLTKQLERRLYGCYTKLLRKALDISWRDKGRNEDLYQGLERVSVILKRRRMKLYGHLHRMADYNPQPACFALLWQHELKFRPGANTYSPFRAS